jgi:uncharacterized membrane protein
MRHELNHQASLFHPTFTSTGARKRIAAVNTIFSANRASELPFFFVLIFFSGFCTYTKFADSFLQG